MYNLLADIILTIHASFVLFVVAALILIYVGALRQWTWVRNSTFRIIHLIAIGIVVMQSWLGVICPLTTLEMWLRTQAGGNAYTGSFVQHWLQTLLYYRAPEWVFVLIYTVFGTLVLGSWFTVKPRHKKE